MTIPNRFLSASCLILTSAFTAADSIEERTDPFGVQQVWVPAGEFTMGSDRVPTTPEWAAKAFATEQPEFRVEISQGFWIDKTEVTLKDFSAFVDDGGYEKPELWSEKGWEWISGKWLGMYPLACYEVETPELPRGCVSYYEAEAYARWRGGRLPTEAEWEYAARGPESLIYPWGNEWSAEKANLSEHVMPVGQFPEGASWVGALDMSGNLMEWVSDWLNWDFNRASQASKDPTGADSGFVKMEKGGWYGSHPNVARAAYHHFEDPPYYADPHIGFRVLSPK